MEPAKKVKYTNLLDLVEKIADDPSYQGYEFELKEIALVIANYVKLINQLRSFVPKNG